ncbi:MAG: dihydroneopterin aldolase [Microbacterium sp.]
MDFMDQITLKGVRAFGRHGVYADEKRDGQYFFVDVVLHLSTTRAAETDDVADTVHYGEVAEQIVAIVEGESVNLLEALAARIADALLERDLVRMVFVTVHKPSAPITVPFKDVSVTIGRGKVEEPASWPGTP